MHTDEAQRQDRGLQEKPEQVSNEAKNHSHMLLAIFRLKPLEMGTRYS